ncbi:MAG: hypothetical protein U1D30_08100 [Planctomycetota bacterium]
MVFPCLCRDVEEFIRTIKILSPHFGWKGEPVITIFSPVPLSGNIQRKFPWWRITSPFLTAWSYLLLPPDTPVPKEWTSFSTLQDHRDIGEPPPGSDPFDQSMRDMYSNYRARLGAQVHGRGQTPRSLGAIRFGGEAFRRSVFALFARLDLFGLVFTRSVSGPLLPCALKHHRLTYDNSAARYHLVTRREIFALMEKLGIDPKLNLRPEDYLE